MSNGIWELRRWLMTGCQFDYLVSLEKRQSRNFFSRSRILGYRNAQMDMGKQIKRGFFPYLTILLEIRTLL